MAGWCRWWRRCRLQAPSKISSRNRSVVYAFIFVPLLLTVLLIPGGEIANYKYSGDLSSNPFIDLFDQNGGPDSVIRETRSLRNKVIVLWHPFFESRSWRVHGNAFQGCEESKCELSLDREKLSEADAVLFDTRGLYNSPELPEEHPPWQVWILHNSEPPYNIYIDLSQYNNVFNWTSWYRTDADIFAPYGYYVDRNGDDPEEVNGRSDDDTGKEEEEEKDVEKQKENDKSDAQSSIMDSDVYHLHDRVLFFAASNCRDRGRRYKKVAQLQRFLPIDVFGDCGIYKCPKFTSECDNIFTKYQFVLAFENGYCRDYITEKLWSAYRRLQIPIVSGGAKYEEFAIPGSYIDYDNFSSVEELAAYIHQVSTDPHLYNSYFTWRQRYKVVSDAPVTDWCQLCEALHDKNRSPQVYRNLEGWVAQDSCPLFSEYQHFWTHIYLGLFKVFGI